MKYPDRPNLMMRCFDIASGKHIARSTRTTRMREAERLAAKWEAELREGRYERTSRMAWDEMITAYVVQLHGQRPATIETYLLTFAAFSELCRPARASDLTTARVVAFEAELLKGKQVKAKGGKAKTRTPAEATIARHLRAIRALANWAHDQEILPKKPRIKLSGKSSGAVRMKGRPVTGEEFDRMLDVTAGIVVDDAAESRKFLLRGLWVSGLRLSEAIALRWDYQPDGVYVVLDGTGSVLAFDADTQKSGKVETVPLASEAVELLEPHQRAAGYVFHPRRKDGKLLARLMLKIGKIISAIGKAAGVVTDKAKGRTATAHDLRRSFGASWAKLVMPATLKQLMRHESIETTITYYVQQAAQVTAAELWAARGTILGNTEAIQTSESQKTS